MTGNGATTLLKHYQETKDDIGRQIDAVTTLVNDREDKQLTQQDQDQLTFLRGRLEKVNADMDAAAITDEVSTRTREALSRARMGVQIEGHVYRDAGSALWDVRHRGDDETARHRLEAAFDRQQRAMLTASTRAVPLWELMLARSAEHMGLNAANTVAPAGGFDALIVDPIQGPIIDLNWTDTPFLTLIGRRTPPARSFRRVQLVDPDFYTVAGPPAGGKEKAEFPSKKWDYVSETISGYPIGNYINLSLFAEDEVAVALNETIEHLRQRTEVSAEAAAIAEAGRTGTTIVLDPDADAAATQKAVWDAMAAVFTATKRPATWLAWGPLGMAMLGAKTDLAGRPLFPQTPVVNGLGTANAFSIVSPFNLRGALTPSIDDTTIYVGNELSLEAYVRMLPVLQVPEPSVAGRAIGVYAMVGFHRPMTKQATTGSDPTPAERNSIVAIKAA